MSKNGLIPTFDVNKEKCKTYMLTTITRQPFPNVKRNYVMLELIHSDLFDLHSTSFLRNKKYIVTFIDDYSRFFFVYLLHSDEIELGSFRSFTGIKMMIKQNKHNRIMNTKQNQSKAYDSNIVTPQQSSMKNFHCRGELGFTILVRENDKSVTYKGCMHAP